MQLSMRFRKSFHGVAKSWSRCAWHHSSA
jgi:hypothetical protein